MVTLSEFLLARIAEDEEAIAASIVHQDQWCFMNPTRALTECKAKRQIAELHPNEGGPEEWMGEDAEWLASDVVCGWCTYDDREVLAPCPTVRALAAPYADHADYNEAWRPS